MRLLVTGGCGYIGSTFVRAYSKQHDITVVDNLSTGHINSLHNLVPLIEGDVGDQKLLEKVIRLYHIEAVVHFAGRASVQESITYPHVYWKNNVLGSISLFEACRKSGVNRIVLSSSCAVYGHNDTIWPLCEKTIARPCNPYGRSKLLMEEAATSYANKAEWDLTILRYFNAAGSDGLDGERHDPPTRILPCLIRTALGQQPSINIYGEDVWRDFIHVSDLADVHNLALEKNAGINIYNVGRGEGTSLKDLLLLVEYHHGGEVKNKTFLPPREGDPRCLVAHCRKIEGDWNWRPQRSLFDIIKSAYSFHKRHYEN
jgi:UDP-glucose 4-epimerase